MEVNVFSTVLAIHLSTCCLCHNICCRSGQSLQHRWKTCSKMDRRAWVTCRVMQEPSAYVFDKYLVFGSLLSSRKPCSLPSNVSDVACIIAYAFVNCSKLPWEPYHTTAKHKILSTWLVTCQVQIFRMCVSENVGSIQPACTYCTSSGSSALHMHLKGATW